MIYIAYARAYVCVYISYEIYDCRPRSGGLAVGLTALVAHGTSRARRRLGNPFLWILFFGTRRVKITKLTANDMAIECN